MAEGDAAEFAEFVASHARQLQRAAWLLTGDWGTAEDLVQTALTKTWQHWPTIRRPDARGAYARRVLMTTFLGWRRRRRVDETLGWIPDRAADGSGETELAENVAVLAALKQLPPRQRAVVVLRYFDDLTEQAAADALGCSVGTVKSQNARALRTLRADSNLQALFAGEDG